MGLFWDATDRSTRQFKIVFGNGVKSLFFAFSDGAPEHSLLSSEFFFHYLSDNRFGEDIQIRDSVPEREHAHIFFPFVEQVLVQPDTPFSRLVEDWHAERGATSSLSEMTSCPSYLRIIAMGEKAVPLILEQLRREDDDPDHWFTALEAISGEDPVPEDAYGDTIRMAEAWITWAEKRNVW